MYLGELGWPIAYTSDGRCGAAIDAQDFVAVHPQAGRLGRRDGAARGSDRLKTAEGTFRINGVPVPARVFLPLF